MQDTAGEVGTSSSDVYSCGPVHMAEQRQYEQLEPTVRAARTYSSFVPIRDVVLKTSSKQ